MNKAGEGAAALHYDPIQTEEPKLRWFLHDDPDVDVAVLPFPMDFNRAKLEFVVLRTEGMVEREAPMADVGCGDLCYVIGLFSKLQGETGNIRVVHTGHIALLANPHERIESRDNQSGVIRRIEGYLAEIANLEGLSGAPVFVRGGLELEVPVGDGNEVAVATVATPALKLLGVWQGSWEGHSASGSRVPVGMGIVTPSWKLIELLDSAAVEENRREWMNAQNVAVAD